MESEEEYETDGSEMGMPDLSMDEPEVGRVGETQVDEATTTVSTAQLGDGSSAQQQAAPPKEEQVKWMDRMEGEEKSTSTSTTTTTTTDNNQKKKRRSTKVKVLLTEDPEVDFETLIREELKKLHRQYRLMEDARHAMAGASGKLSKQGGLVERLRNEKEELETDLNNVTCRAYRARDKQSINTILEALERYEKYKSDINTCLISLQEMERNVDKITQRLVEQRLKVQALYGQSMTVPEADHRKMILEDRLYIVTTCADTLVYKNRYLKEEINMMLKLRGSFYRRMLLIKKISAKIKQRMGDVVIEATNAYDQRDDCMVKVNMLRERNDKDSKQHVLEIKEFQRVLHHDSKIHEFLAIKNRERELMENTKQRLERKNRGKISELEALLASYKRSFKAILRMARSKNIDNLVSTYLEEEHRNYAMFKFITDLNHEINCLQVDIVKFKGEIEILSKTAKEVAAKQEKVLTDLDKKLDDSTDKLDSTLKQWSAADIELEDFGNLLDEAFTEAGCSNEPIVQLLGNQNGMGPHNICMCMKVLEHRITELLHDKGMLEVRKSVELDGQQVPKKTQLWVQGQKPPPQGGPFKPIVHVTGRIDSEQEDEDAELKAWSERPIYYKEMKNVIRQSMQTMPVVEEDTIKSHAPASERQEKDGKTVGPRSADTGAQQSQAATAPQSQEALTQQAQSAESREPPKLASAEPSTAATVADESASGTAHAAPEEDQPEQQEEEYEE